MEEKSVIDISVIDLLPTLASRFGDPVRIIELGANDGYHTRLLSQIAASLGRPWQYVALEPDPRLRPGIPPGVHFLPYAISDKDGESDFYLSGGVSDQGDRYTGSSSLREPTDVIRNAWPKMTFDQTVKVRTITLDSVCAQFGFDHVDFIWSDVQGCEIDAIRGGLETLRRTKYFYAEYIDAELYKGQAFLAGLVDALKGIMSVHTVFPGDVLFKNDSLVQ